MALYQLDSSHNVEYILNDWEGSGKKIVAYLKILFQSFPKGTEGKR
jgi:hypothetical protein